MQNGHQLFPQSGARRMFPHRRTWEARLRLWPAPQIMTIPALIRVLWLMFDEGGDRLRGCFQHVCTPVSWVIPSVKQEGFSLFFFSPSTLSSPLPLVFSSLLHCPYTQVFCFFFSSLQVVFHVSSSEDCFHTEENNSDSKTLYNKAVVSGRTVQSEDSC